MIRLRFTSRVTQVLGILLALSGLLGYWLTHDVQRTVLSSEESGLLNPEGAAFQASFVVAGRDYDYDPAGPLVWQGGEQVRSFTTEARLGQHTDTIIYVNIVDNRATMISIPRDVYLAQHRQKVEQLEQAKINALYTSGRLIYGGDNGGDNRADYLRRAVSELLDLPVDYYAVVDIGIFGELVDAIGGVELNVPLRMEHVDRAANLNIDLEPGFQHLDGEQAANFVRFRNTLRGDIDRIDNVKTLAYAVLRRLQELNVRALSRVPALVDTYLDKVETNLSPALVAQLVPRLGQLELQAATLPTHEEVVEERENGELQTKQVLSYRPEEVEGFLAGLFGGRARDVTRTPDASVTITNRSGVPGLGAEVRRQLVAAGVPAAQLRTRSEGRDPVTRVVVTNAALAAAPYYADLLGVGWQQIERFDATLKTDVELILGSDARDFKLATQARGGDDHTN